MRRRPANGGCVTGLPPAPRLLAAAAGRNVPARPGGTAGQGGARPPRLLASALLRRQGLGSGSRCPLWGTIGPEAGEESKSAGLPRWGGGRLPLSHLLAGY